MPITLHKPCPHGKEDYPEGSCLLWDGHIGPHRSRWDMERDQRIEAHPTLSAIRAAIREEVRQAIKERFP